VMVPELVMVPPLRMPSPAVFDIVMVPELLMVELLVKEPAPSITSSEPL